VHRWERFRNAPAARRPASTVRRGEAVGFRAERRGKTTVFTCHRLIKAIAAPSNSMATIHQPAMYQRARGHRLPAAGSVDLPRSDGGAEHSAVLEVIEPQAKARAELNSLLDESTSPAAQVTRHASRGDDVVSRSHARLRPRPIHAARRPFAGIDRSRSAHPGSGSHPQSRHGVLITDHNVRERWTSGSRLYRFAGESDRGQFRGDRQQSEYAFSWRGIPL